MTITITGQDVVIKTLDKLLDDMEPRFAQALADEAARIVLRTRQGKNADGSAMKDYSPAYAKFRKDKGRRTSPVDLTFTGNMINAIQTQVQKSPTGFQGTIFFNSAKEAAKAQGNQQKRPFFRLSDEQVKRITQKLGGSRTS